jgi:hypothetical protein
MGAKQRCLVCGRLQRVPDDDAEFTCDGCGGQLGPERVRRTPPGLWRRLMAVGMMLVGMLFAVSLLLEEHHEAPLRKGRETRWPLIGLLFPAILIFGGVTLAKGKIEPLPDESTSEPGSSPDQPEGSAGFWVAAETEGDSLLGPDVPLTP